MNVVNHYNSNLPRLFSANALTIGKHIFYARSERKTPSWLRRHEETHVKQYQVYGVVGFLAIYLFEYVKGRLKGLSHFEAYQDITFEIEARHNERR